MKAISKAAAFAIPFEIVMALLTCLTFSPGGALHGPAGFVGSVAWGFHGFGESLALKLSQDNTTIWLIMWLVGLLQSFIIGWLAIEIGRTVSRKHAS